MKAEKTEEPHHILYDDIKRWPKVRLQKTVVIKFCYQT